MLRDLVALWVSKGAIWVLVWLFDQGVAAVKKRLVLDYMNSGRETG